MLFKAGEFFAYAGGLLLICAAIWDAGMKRYEKDPDESRRRVARMHRQAARNFLIAGLPTFLVGLLLLLLGLVV
jgi:hypothetical protein